MKYRRSLPVAFQDLKDSIRLVKLDDSLVSVNTHLLFLMIFKLVLIKGKKVIVRHLLNNSLTHKLTQYAQLHYILDYLDKTPFNLVSELESSGNNFEVIQPWG